MSELSDVVHRLERLESIEAIRKLVAMYTYAADDRDFEVLRDMFTPDVCFRSANGATEVKGIDAVVNYYHARFQGMKHSFHVTHDHVIDFQSDVLASGRVSSHAEMLRDGEPHIVALRYDDIYGLDAGRWCFRQRTVSFYYYAKAADYREFMQSKLRVRASDVPVEADWPEGTATFINYQPSKSHFDDL